MEVGSGRGGGKGKWELSRPRRGRGWGYKTFIIPFWSGGGLSDSSNAVG